TAVAGQVLPLNAEPLAEVTVETEVPDDSRSTTRTDRSGRFLLIGPQASGHWTLIIDGRSASTPGRTYGVFEVGVSVTAGTTNVLPFTSWMPRIDTAHAVTTPPYVTSEIVVTTPRIPGLEVRIPAHSVIRDHEGRVTTQISL